MPDNADDRVMQHRPVMDPVGLTRDIPLLPHQMLERVTAADNLFMLSHLGVPHIDSDTWKLSISGLVHSPIELDLEALRKLPKGVVESVHECAGNPLDPTTAHRRVANVIWGGAWLTDVLKLAGVKDDAVYLWSFGADYGDFAGVKVSSFGKDLPLSRVAEGSVLLAYELNGEPLPRRHGAPVRLFVPGFYGTNSVKWLTRLELAPTRLEALFTTVYYNDPGPYSETGESTGTVPVWAIAPESIITAPAPDAVIDNQFNITGWAWGFNQIETVEISDDGGLTWSAASVMPRCQRGWQPFSFDWMPKHSGAIELACRATDSEGNTQPEAGARNHIHTVSLTVIL